MSGKKAAGSASIVPRKTTTTTSTPAKEAGVELQDSGQEISEEDASVEGDSVIDPASIIAMQQELRVIQKQLARLTVKPVLQQPKANVAQETAGGPCFHNQQHKWRTTGLLH